MNHPRSSARLRLTVLTVCMFLTAKGAAAQERSKQKVSAASTIGSGSDLYHAYCASCHGKNGQGDGPAASALRTPPANLTLLSARNQGRFPRTRVIQTIRGEALKNAHGSSEMPVWGPYFLILSRTDEADARRRIDRLADYVESLQTRVEASNRGEAR